MRATTESTGIACSACGEELTAGEVRSMEADTDFLQHGQDNHYAGFEPTPENFDRARRIVRATTNHL